MSRRHLLPFISTQLALAVLLAVPAWAHEGHDHGAPQPVTSDPSLVVRSASNENYEVVLKYRSVRGQKSAAVRVYLSDFATNAPVEGARLGLRTTSPRQITATTAMASPGVYEATLSHEQPGQYTLILAVGASPPAEFAFQALPMGEDLVPQPTAAGVSGGLPWWLMGGVVVALLAAIVFVIRRRSMRPISRTALVLVATASGAAPMGWMSAARESRAAQATASAPAAASQPRYMPKESQFFLGVRTIVGQLESLRGRVRAVGHVVPESGALASVEAPQDGKLEGGHRLAVGDRVRQGQVIANLLVIDRLPIRAPISGLVAEVHFTSGQWVQAGDPLIVILDERRVRVELPLFGENLNLALRTRNATVSSTALPGFQFPARVRGLAPTAPEAVGKPGEETAAGSPIPPLILTVTNRGGLLRPGMLVEVSLELPTTQELIAVPESAVIRQESGSAVFVHTGPEVFEQRPVRVVGSYGNRVGLAGAIRPGDRIVVEGAQALVSAPPVTLSAAADSTKDDR